MRICSGVCGCVGGGVGGMCGWCGSRSSAVEYAALATEDSQKNSRLNMDIDFV